MLSILLAVFTVSPNRQYLKACWNKDLLIYNDKQHINQLVFEHFNFALSPDVATVIFTINTGQYLDVVIEY